MQNQFLTTFEVAQLLRLSVDTVYGLITKGHLPPTEIGSQWRFE